MCSNKTVLFLAAGVLVVLALPIVIFGLLFLWASFAPNAESGWSLVGALTSCVGVMMIGGAIALLFLALRPKPASNTQNITLKVDLPGEVKIDTMQCKSCGGSLTMDNIQMVAGAPVVSCPYCQTTYQLTEEPKW